MGGKGGKEQKGETKEEVDCAVFVVGVSLGPTHTAFVTRDGQVWTAGCCTKGQCGREATGKSINAPKGRDGKRAVTIVKRGQYKKGGQGSDGNDTVDFGPVDLKAASALHRALQVNCGMAHTSFVTANGEVWTAGDNSDGQLGRDTASAISAAATAASTPATASAAASAAAEGAGDKASEKKAEESGVVGGKGGKEGAAEEEEEDTSFDGTFALVPDFGNRRGGGTMAVKVVAHVVLCASAKKEKGKEEKEKEEKKGADKEEHDDDQLQVGHTPVRSRHINTPDSPLSRNAVVYACVLCVLCWVDRISGCDQWLCGGGCPFWLVLLSHVDHCLICLIPLVFILLFFLLTGCV